MLGLGKLVFNSVRFYNKSVTDKLLPNLPQYVRGIASKAMDSFGPDWENDLPKALRTAKEVQKPVMLVVYRPWCTYCQYLSRELSKSTEIKSMKEHFVMAQVNEDEDDLGNKYAPDGGLRYVPRILFLTPDGDVIKDAKNHKAYKDGALYVYNEVPEIMDSMNHVLKNYFLGDVNTAIMSTNAQRNRNQVVQAKEATKNSTKEKKPKTIKLKYARVFKKD